MPRSLSLIAAGIAAVLVLSGCGPDEPKPNYSSVSAPPTTSSPTPSDTTAAPNTTANVPSGAVEPTLPPTAADNSSDGAFAFVAYYWKRLDWAYSTVDGDTLTGLYAPTCKSCESSRQSINDVSEKGNSLRGGHLTINSQSLADASSDPSASFAIDTALTVEALTEVDGGGATIKTYPASSYSIRAFVAWSRDHFIVTATANLNGG